jgi:small GTP-binding protein
MPRNLIKKICLLGDGEVGKTSLIRKFVYDEFDDKYLMTIGTKITKKTMIMDSGQEDINLTMMINDIVGQVEFERIHKQYYRGSKAGIFVCDLTRKNTLERMEWWLDSFNEVVGGVPIILLGNKLDLVEQRQISESDIVRFAKNFNCSYFLTSAKTGENVEMAFEKIGRCLCSTTT